MITRRWEDLVTLGLTEIREFGSTSVQVMRRLRALLDELLATVLPEHRAALEEEMRRLNATVAESWRGSVDLDRAGGADRQGIGGA
jgi:division protein CdvB (Snf7/Vps24/ESCRT-III family)